MLMVDAVTPVVVPLCGSPQAPPAAGRPPPGAEPPPALLTVPPALLPPATTAPGAPPAPGEPGPTEPGEAAPGTLAPGAARRRLLAAGTGPGEPDLSGAVASGLIPHAVVSDDKAMAPASSWMPVRGRFIVVSGVRGA